MLNRLPALVSLLPRRLLNSSTRLLSWMEAATVRCVPGESKLTISFRLDGSNKQMLRDQDEPLGKVLARISNGVIKSQNKAKKSKKSRGETPGGAVEVPGLVKLYLGGEEVPETVLNSEAWRDGAVLQVGAVRYSVQRNAPTFTVAELPSSLLSGFPVCPKLEVEFGAVDDSEFTWFKDMPSSVDGGPSVDQEGVWSEVSRERVFVPSNQDIGCRLRLRCTPRDGTRRGLPKDLLSAGAVEAGPGVCTFDNRHAYTRRETSWPTVRVVTYNVLADVYAQTELSKTVLYPYCASYALQLDYRQNLIKKELAGYHGDIVCLQEVDKGVFTDSLSPAMDAFGMGGVYKIKEKQHEGLATFYRRSRFRLLSRHDITLSEALTSDPAHSELLQTVSENDFLREKMMKRSTVLQVSVLQDLHQSERRLCVANTHLYWHPKGSSVRLVQMGVALKHLSHVIKEVAPGAPVIFCGDFNSTPSSGVVQLLTEARLPRAHTDWISGGSEDSVGVSVGLDLVSPLPPLLSACGQLDYTNYVGGFQGCLDYIFIQPETMQVEQVIPLPAHDEVTTYDALPSVAHPSDHIALVCDLRWAPDLLLNTS
ncbi:2',5'-phosphodiesterase 12 isoform X2 [Gouania willdenowi]|uniref:2',5'-phosphodiesterase 12 isoform X2 n=1 Tax=Gouania willdenowi TaxID=441366 RepID=UPI001056D585|nr:2',5'-phosphodiesterase 12 isoform X2 [Gouania willdenowi]